MVLYTASTLYHSINHSRARPVLHVLDHSAIYLLIAGSYTPFMLVTLRGPWGWSLLAVVWAACITGISLRAALGHRMRIVHSALYVTMGWVGIVALRPLPGESAFSIVVDAPAGYAYVGTGGYNLGEIVKLRLPDLERVGTLFVGQGDFTAAVIDPANGLPFAGNIIPASRIDPMGKAFAALYPAPNQPGNDPTKAPSASRVSMAQRPAAARTVGLNCGES